MKRLAPIGALIYLFLLLASSSFALESETRTYSPVQDGFATSSPVVSTYAPDRVLVKFTPEGLGNATIRPFQDKSSRGNTGWTGLASLDAVLDGLDVSRITQMHGSLKNKAEAERLGIDRWYRVDVAVGTDIDAAVASLAADLNLEAALPDLRAFPATTPNDPLNADNWGHNNTAQLPDLDWGGTYEHDLPTTVGTVGFDTNAQTAWGGSQGYGSSGVVIAILDSGVDSSHPDLVQVAGYDFGDNDTNPHDDSADPGHGTACAGVAAATADNNLGAVGIAGGCSIMPLKVADSAGSLFFSYITSAIYHAADNGADVISMSFGAAGLTTYALTDNAIQYAYNAGVTLLAATGNENDSAIGYPSVNTNVISVGAASPCGDRKRSSSVNGEVNTGVNTDPNGYTCDGERWWGSNYGIASQDSRYAVDIIAPTILPTTDIQGSAGYDPGDYSGFFNGTSCATPYAAGVCALIKSKNPSWTPAQVRAQLTSTAIDIVNVESVSGWDRYSGYGMVDAAAAVDAGVVPPPVADFAGTPTTGCAPLTVDFTDLSTGDITSWDWSFGDGQTSTLQNPSNIFASSGTYDVTLTVTGPGGFDSSTLTGYISVTEGVTADFSVTATTGVAPLAVDFTDLSTGLPTEWFWDFGDTGTDVVQNPSHTYTAAGTYTVMLVATSACGPDTLVQADLIVVDPPAAPVVAFSGDPVSGCVPLEVTFTDETTGDVTDWAWDFGDGGSSTDQNPVHIFTSPGDFDVRLIAIGPGGPDTLTSVAYISVIEGVTADFSASATTGVAPLTVDFTDLSTGLPTEWIWDFGDTGTDVVQNPSHTYTAAGTYTVMLVATSACGPDTLVQADLIVVDPPAAPVVAFSGDPVSGCVPLEVTFTDETTGDITDWAWEFGDGGSSTDQNPVHIFTSPGDFDVRLIATGPGGPDTLTSVAYISVTEGVTADFSASATTGIAPLTVDFTDLSTGLPTEWFWDFGDTGTDIAQNPSHTYTAAGTYSVMLVATGACGPDTLVMADLIVVDPPAAPVAAFSGDPVSGCAPLGVAFTDESSGEITTWAWDFGDGGTDTAQNPTHLFVTAGTYSVSLTVTGPGGSDVKILTDYIAVEEPVAAAFAVSEVTGLAPLEINFTDESTGSPTFWLWDFGDATTDTVQNPSHTFTTVDLFTVTLITGNSCSRDTLVMVDLVDVTAVSGVGDLVPARYSLQQNVPNPFNPMTTIYFELPEPAAVRLQVFDISGRMIRSLLNGASLGAGRQDVVWNGRDDSGQQVAAGVYFYHLNAGSFNETRRMTLVK